MNENTTPGTSILSFAEHLAGEGADSTVLSAMCDAAAAEIESRLREGITLQDLGSVYVTAAGVLALSMYCAAKDPGPLLNYQAGNLSLKYGENAAEKLRAEAERMLADKLADRGFGFVGVRG